MPKLPTLGVRLAQERRIRSVELWRDLEHGEIATAVGVSGATISRYESDLTKPDDDTLGRLADYYGVTRSYLRFGEGDRKPLKTRGQLPKATEAPNGEAGDQERRKRK